jgi:hypothetical protein
MKRTDHVLLVGEGARRFATLHGFPHENLLTLLFFIILVTHCPGVGLVHSKTQYQNPLENKNVQGGDPP